MNYKRLEPDFIHLESVDSTNNYAANLLKETKPVNGTAILTKRQTAGKGQRGNTWETEPVVNLTFSVIIYPEISVAHVFQLNMIASLAVSKAISSIVDDVSIKWPNDILAGSKKIAGILIENQFRGNLVASSIIGIGVNVNQTEFDDSFNACSLKSLTQQHFNPEDVFIKIYEELDFYLNVLMEQNFALLSKRYHERFFGLNQVRNFEDNKGRFEGIIKGIDENGLLRIQRQEGIKKYDLKEVGFVF